MYECEDCIHMPGYDVNRMCYAHRRATQNTTGKCINCGDVTGTAWTCQLCAVELSAAESTIRAAQELGLLP